MVKYSLCIAIYLFFIIRSSYCGLFTSLYPRIKLETTDFSNAGSPLIITPFIKNGSVELAQELSKVSITENLGIRSHAGFFTVNEKYDSNHYFWYFSPVNDNEEAPVVLWLQGGPGGSSLFGLFTEIGPLVANKDGFSLRDFHWAHNYHLLFIDNPVGTGFSFTRNDNGYCTNEECVATDLFSSLQQFFMLFPRLKSNKFYILGESYAGKYIPALAMKIHKERLNNKINLRGLAMGNAYCDPINQMDYGKYLYQHGLLDLQQKNMFESLQNKIKAEINDENWETADILMDKLMDGQLSNGSYFKLFTGFDNYYNFLNTNSDETDMTVFAELLKNDIVRKSVHVGNLPFNSGEEVQLHLAYDLLKSVSPYVGYLLSFYEVLLYNGQLDIIVAYPLTEEFVRNLNFTSAKEYRRAERHIWMVDDEVAGYVKVAGNLTEVLVRNAGHMVPHDQPKWAYDMITRFIEHKRFW